MKHHIIVKSPLKPNALEYPFWGDVANGISAPQTTFVTEVDDLFRAYNLGFVVTAEYPKSGRLWTPDELKTQLNTYYRIILTEDKNIPPDLVKRIQLIPNIQSVTVSDFVTSPLPNTSVSQSVVHGAQIDNARRAIGLHEVRAKSMGHPDIKVAILDTGIDLKHPELQHCLIGGYDFVDIISGANQFVGDYLGYDVDPSDEVGHGTHVAGIIGAKGIAMPPGVVPNCKIMPVRVLGAMNRGNSKVGAGLVGNINAGIKWAVDNGADVINMSLGIVHEGGGLPHEEVVNYAKEKGVTIVAATGNDGKDSLYFPSALPHVIAVGALDELNDRVAPFSTFGDQVDFVAPGTDIYSTYLDGNYAFSSGTSHSSPFVTGAVALLKSYAHQKGKTLKDKHIKYILKHTSDRFNQRYKDIKLGYGMINLNDALKLTEYKLNIK